VVSSETSFHKQFLDVPIRKREPQIGEGLWPSVLTETLRGV